MNEHVLWIFLCIQYENSCFRVYKTKRLLCSVFNGLVYSLPSMATHLPSPEVLTSFVLPAHNQGVSYAPLRGHAPWIIFLPTTGSFFVFMITDSLPVTALRPVDVICYILFDSVTAHTTASTIVTCLSYAACR